MIADRWWIVLRESPCGSSIGGAPASPSLVCFPRDVVIFSGESRVAFRSNTGLIWRVQSWVVLLPGLSPIPDLLQLIIGCASDPEAVSDVDCYPEYAVSV